MVQYLVDHGADVNENPTDTHDLTYNTAFELGPPLHYAVRRRYLSIMKYLLDHGADATLCDINGRDLIDESVLDGNASAELLSLLRERGIEIPRRHLGGMESS